MSKKILNSLKKEILECQKRLKELEPTIGKNTELETIYNKTLIKKAVLTKKYNNLCHKPTLKDKIKKLLRVHSKKKLICDYFKTSEV